MLAVFHHNFNKDMEQLGKRTIESTTSQYSRIAAKDVDKHKKTQVQHVWMRAFVLDAGTRRTATVDDVEEEDNEDEQNADEFGFETEFLEWDRDVLVDEVDV
jgi:hypothetical protein